jgi:hypothetical protein
LFSLLIVASTLPLGVGCLSLSLGGKHFAAPPPDNGSPAVQEKLKSLDARVRVLEQSAPPGSPSPQISP